MGKLALVKEVVFNGKTVKAAREGDKIYVSVRDVCNNLGMKESKTNHQVQKIKNDEFLKGGCKFNTLKTSGGIQQVLTIELDYLPIWLAKINPSRFSDELKEELMDYQLNAKDVLAEAFLGKRSRRITIDQIQVPQMMIPIGKSKYWEEIKNILLQNDEIRDKACERMYKISTELVELKILVDDIYHNGEKIKELIEEIEK